MCSHLWAALVPCPAAGCRVTARSLCLSSLLDPPQRARLALQCAPSLLEQPDAPAVLNSGRCPASAACCPAGAPVCLQPLPASA